MKKLKMTAAAGGILVLGLALGSCGGPEEPEGTPTPPAATEAPTATEAPVEPTPHLDPPAPYTEPDTTDSWGGLFAEEELDELFLEGVREEPSTPAVRATDDATLLEYGRSVCPAIEAGATFADFDFPGLDPYLDAPIVAGAAVGTYCPDLIEAAVGGDLDAVLDDYLEA